MWINKCWPMSDRARACQTARECSSIGRSDVIGARYFIDGKSMIPRTVGAGCGSTVGKARDEAHITSRHQLKCSIDLIPHALLA